MRVVVASGLHGEQGESQEATITTRAGPWLGRGQGRGDSWEEDGMTFLTSLFVNSMFLCLTNLVRTKDQVNSVEA